MHPGPSIPEFAFPPGSTPLYWRDETSGVLVPAITALVTPGQRVTAAQLRLLTAYVRQWVMAGAWDANPHHCARSLAELASLRAAVDNIRTVGDLQAWLAMAADMHMDPL